MLPGTIARHPSSAVGKGLAVTCLLVFLCFCSMDMQIRSFQELPREADGLEELLLLPKNASVSEKTDTKPPQVSRRLSYHTEEDYYFFRDLRDYDDDEGNDVNLRTLLPALRGTEQKSSAAHKSAETLARRLPHVIIIGVKKGGTRALLEILRLHPDVRAPGPEPHFFDRHFHKGLRWYRRQMPSSLEGQITIEKTPSYFVTPEVPSRIHSTLNNVKLLVVVRDPVTRAVSDYTQASSKRPMDTRTFEEMAFLNFSTGLVDTNWSAIKIGVYTKHLQRWLLYFPMSQFHFVSGEKLISDPVAELDSVQKFLGLRPLIREHHFFFNQTKGFPCLRRSPHSTAPHCLGKTKGRSHPRIPPSAEQRLRDFYRPFNQKFYRMVGRNFGWP